MNGELVPRATGNQPGSMLAKVASDPKLRQRGEDSLPVPGRPCRGCRRSRSLNISNELLVARQGNVGSALQDIWWAVLNTNEFILIH